jgi:Kef-type K+ transport system membrane component KefB
MLGPSFFAIQPPGFYGMLAQVAGGLFLFLAGWEMTFLNVIPDRKFYLSLIVGSFIIPCVAGWFAFHNLFLAAAIGISALPVAIQILKEKSMYATPFGRRAITIASICDLGAWIGLAWMLPSESLSSWVIGHWPVLAFFVGLLLGRVYPWAENRGLLRFQAWVLAPIFFVGLGWKIDLLRLFDAAVFFQVLVVAIISKSVGTYVFSRLAGENHRSAWNFAGILNARGAMEILAANYAFQAGIISGGFFSALVLLGIVTSLMAVPLVRR